MRYNRNMDEKTQKIILHFILDCPSSIKDRKQYLPVSKRACSFRERGIKDSLLRTLLSQVKNLLPSKECYAKIESGHSVEEEQERMEKENTLADPRHEYIILRDHSSMTETEAVFYYIRNAFAHGAFIVEDIHGMERLYSLESEKTGKLNAKMLLKESTLLKLFELSQMTPEKLKQLQRKRRIPAFQ